MAVLASPDVGIRRRALLRTARLACDWPDLHACAACRAVALTRRRTNLTHGRRTAELRARFHGGGSELTFVTTVISKLSPLFISERENGNLSYLDLEGAFPLVKYTNQKTESKNI